MEALRFIILGSVDDGKSTLAGRLLFDSAAVKLDVLNATKKSSLHYANMEFDLSLLLDGLRSERAQGITIDVGYRFFATATRKFVMIDAPGHASYTRNAVTGLSHADLAILVIDAKKGVSTQTKRHALLAKLTGVPSIVCINKMDNIEYSETKFLQIQNEVALLYHRLQLEPPLILPTSALHGDGIVNISDNLKWFKYGSLLSFLEKVEVANHDAAPMRFPIQGVIRARDPQGSLRIYSGSLASGSLKVGQKVKILPGNFVSEIMAMPSYDGPMSSAAAPEAILVQITGEHDIGRGDLMIPFDETLPALANFEADIFWLAQQEGVVGERYFLRFMTSEIDCVLEEVLSKKDVESFNDLGPTKNLIANDVARVRLRLSRPAHFDDFKKNKITGSGILIDRRNNDTVAAILFCIRSNHS